MMVLKHGVHGGALLVLRDRRFVLKRPRRDINGGGETEVTVTSKRHAQTARAKKEKREEKSASNGGAVRDPGPEDGAQERERAAARG